MTNLFKIHTMCAFLRYRSTRAIVAMPEVECTELCDAFKCIAIAMLLATAIQWYYCSLNT